MGIEVSSRAGRAYEGSFSSPVPVSAIEGPGEARGLSIYELAARCGVSTHSVSRFARRLGSNRATRRSG